MGAPASFDPIQQWPQCTVINNVRDQSACGSCWAFGSVSSFESRDCTSTGKDIKYSPEDTAFCSNAGNGCSGGDSTWGYEFGVSRYKMFSKCSTITLRLLAA